MKKQSNRNWRRPRFWMWLCVITLGGLWLGVDAAGTEGTDAFEPLFNGRDLTGWQVPDPNPYWRVVDGVIVGQNDPQRKGSMLWTERSFRDFIFECEARWNGEIDSGVLFRRSADQRRELQLQMGVSRSLKQDLTGSFYVGGTERYPETGRAHNFEAYFRPGQWNHFRLEAQGDRFRVWINGQPAVTNYINTNFPLAGPIGLQIHPGLDMKVEFRNVRVRRLD